MKCPTCETDMKTRSGKFGDFYFCPNQHVCKQKTITKNKEVVVSHLQQLVMSSSVGANPYEQSALEIHYQLCKDHIEWLYGDFY